MNDADTNANVYAPPETDIRQSPADGGNGFKIGNVESRKLYNHSRSVGALVFLWCLGLVVMVAVFIPNVMASAKQAGGNTEGVNILIGVSGVMSLLMLAGIVGCWMRTTWGRIIGFILCALMLLNFWLGTLIGIFGLIALTNGKRLFGPDRLTHRYLKETVAAYKSTERKRR